METPAQYREKAFGQTTRTQQTNVYSGGSSGYSAYKEATSSQSKGETPAEYNARVEAQKEAAAQQAREQETIRNYQTMGSPVWQAMQTPETSRPLTQQEISSLQSRYGSSQLSPVMQDLARENQQQKYANIAPEYFYSPITGKYEKTGGTVLRESSQDLRTGYDNLQTSVSERIPTIDDISEKGREFRYKHPEAADTLYQSLNFGAKVVKSSPNRDVEKAGEVVGHFSVGFYEGVQEKPLDTATMVAVGALTGPAMGAASKLPLVARTGAAVSKVPVVGGAISKYGLAAGFTGWYGFDLHSRVTAPVMSDGFLRDPTAQEQAGRLGKAVSTEIIPFAIGAGLTNVATRTKNPIVQEKPGPAEYDVIKGFELKTAPDGTVKTRLKTDTVSEDAISLAERQRYLSLQKDGERILNAKYDHYIMEDGVTNVATGSGTVKLSKPVEVVGGQKTLSGDEILHVRQAPEWSVKMDVPKGYDSVRAKTLDRYASQKTSLELEMPWETNTFKTIESTALIKQPARPSFTKDPNVISTKVEAKVEMPWETNTFGTLQGNVVVTQHKQPRIDFIRGRFTGQPVKKQPPEMSGITQKNINIEGAKFSKEVPWEQSGVDQFHSKKVTQLADPAAKTYAETQGHPLAKTMEYKETYVSSKFDEKINPLFNIKEPAADMRPASVNLNIKPDVIKSKVKPDPVRKMEVRDDVDIVLADRPARPASQSALSRDIVAEQIIDVRPTTIKSVVGYTETSMPIQAAFPGMGVSPVFSQVSASFTSIGAMQNVAPSLEQNIKQNIIPSQDQIFSQELGFDQIQAIDTAQRQGQRQSQRQTSRTTEVIESIPRSRPAAKDIIPPLPVIAMPYVPSRKAAKQPAGRKGSGKESNLFNKYNDPLEMAGRASRNVDRVLRGLR